ncbi:CAP domain-containing protein [Jidongwangia harbinensis]|uniref:CAP domain-containing protein n=1 Tax=Jidongwangia harbinensis TaxID=2878561 RepID=UPI001CDA531A|nr:CAP domain-containing protein [Jidongwangia harbinensis]MCA2215123.1 CAP domain-containing protein [Jidongwangia harbinensis]
MPVQAALALTVTGLLGAFGLGAAMLPASLTGSGTAADRTGAAAAPGTGGGIPGARPASRAPRAPSASAAPKASTTPKPTPSKTRPKATTRPKPKVTPTRKRTTAATTRVSSDQVSQENEVIRLVNVERDDAGCGSVRLNTRLRTAMRLHVAELGRHDDLYISHVSDDGRSFVDRAKAQGYDSPGGENVARGQRDAAAVMTSWMNSDGHRKNILNCDFSTIGVGVVKGVDGTLVWGQLFGRS